MLIRDNECHVRKVVAWLNGSGALQRLSRPCVQPVREEEEQENLMMQRMLGHANCAPLSSVRVNFIWNFLEILKTFLGNL